MQKQLIEKKAKFYIIDAVKLGLALGLGARINMIMQTAFFKISGILPEQEAIDAIKKAIKKTYGSKGDKVVQMNYSAVTARLPTSSRSLFRRASMAMKCRQPCRRRRRLSSRKSPPG